MSKELGWRRHGLGSNVPWSKYFHVLYSRSNKHRRGRQMGVIPVSFIEKRLTSKEIGMRSHGLGSNGAKALAVTMVVSRFHIRYKMCHMSIGVIDVE